MIEITATGLAMMVTIAGAMVAAGARSIVHAIFGLAIALGGIAATFAILGSPFVAAMEVLIYIGGITVAMVFAVMLSSSGQREPTQANTRRVLAGIVSAMLIVGVGSVLIRAEYPPRPDVAQVAQSVEAQWSSWSVEAIGMYLLNEFNVVFELLSVVLLVAIVGAITIAGRDDESLDPALPEEDDA
jgi:NADH-quinone oxidoreductase subunit J